MTEPEQRLQAERKRRQLYGRRKGPKLSARQLELRRTLLEELKFDPSKEAFGQYPNDVRELWLEVGFGAGEHLFQLAEENPHIGLIGAEPYESGVAKLLSKLADSPRPNIRIYEGDGREVIAALPEASLSRFFLLFPDPWPKTRHHKRRFLQTILQGRTWGPSGGGIWSAPTVDVERLMAHPAFEWTARGPKDWKIRPADWPSTRYEAKAIKGPPAYLRVLRRRKPGPAPADPGCPDRTSRS